MAKSSSAQKGKATTKAEATRDHLRANPNAKVREVTAALAAKGIKVSDNHVYMIKNQAKARSERPTAPRQQ